MGNRVYNTTFSPTSYDLVTQTPENYTKENFYLHSLQDKIDADWEYRPNRVDVEQEDNFGEEDYFPLEVVIQTVRNDKGEKVSDDACRLVFKKIDYKVPIGTRFRFSYNFDLEEPNIEKDVWITTNKNNMTPTAQAVLTRCNGTLGSIYKNQDEENIYHYEPVICTTDLSGVNFSGNNVITIPQATIALIVQHNKYTHDYYLNQRFVVGYDKIYKIKGINNFNSAKTYKPDNAGLLILYAEIDEISPKDDFKNRIAYNKDNQEVEPEIPVVDNYYLKIETPNPLPTELFSETIYFTVKLFNGDTATDIPVQVSTELYGAPMPEKYYELNIIDGNNFTLRRKKLFNRSLLKVECFVPAKDNPAGQDFSQSFEMSLRGLE